MKARSAARLLRTARHLLGAERPIVLMYHRVATLACDPWQLAVTPEYFNRQIVLLCEAREVVPLSWLAGKIRNGKPPKRAAAVTFDDGYADVFHHALPILQAHGCPATLFITTGALHDPSIFWWDILSRIILETSDLPESLSFPLSGTVHDFRIANRPDQAGQGISRHALHQQLHGYLKLSRAEVRHEAIHHLAEWAGVDADARMQDRAMTEDELRSFSSTGGMEIGAHTLSHPSLPGLAADEIAREIELSHNRCRDITERPVAGFAYPYGDYDERTAAAVRSAGMAYACTTEAREVGVHVELHAIPRLLAADWDAEEFRSEVLAHG